MSQVRAHGDGRRANPAGRTVSGRLSRAPRTAPRSERRSRTSCSPPAGTRSPSCRTFQGLPVSAVKAERSTRRPTRIRSATAASGSSWRDARSARSKSPAISRCSGPPACSPRRESNATSCRSCAPGCRPITPSLDLPGSPAEHFPLDAVASAFKAFVLRIAGNPEQFGAPTPPDNILEAGVSLSTSTICRLWRKGGSRSSPGSRASRRGQRVTFADGTEEEVDAPIFGTGYVFDWDLLDDELSARLDADAEHVDTHKFTFHPDLPGLAFVGLFHQVGPFLPVLEQQARWVAYAWSGARSMPSEGEMRTGVEAYRSRRHLPQLVPMHTTARIFAGEAGVEPDVRDWPDLVRPLLFGPLTPISYRLSGRDCLADARESLLGDAAAFGVVPSLSCCRNSAHSFRCWLPRGTIWTSPHSSPDHGQGIAKHILLDRQALARVEEPGGCGAPLSRRFCHRVEITTVSSSRNRASLHRLSRYLTSPRLRSRKTRALNQAPASRQASAARRTDGRRRRSGAPRGHAVSARGSVSRGTR